MDNILPGIAIAFAFLLRYGVPIAAAVWLLRAVYRMSLTVEDIRRRVEHIEETLRTRAL